MLISLHLKFSNKPCRWNPVLTHLLKSSTKLKNDNVNIEQPCSQKSNIYKLSHKQINLIIIKSLNVSQSPSHSTVEFLSFHITLTLLENFT